MTAAVRRIRAVLLAVALLGTLTAEDCEGPPAGDRDGGPVGSLVCEISVLSAPYLLRGPSPDGANFYKLTSRGESDVRCTGAVAQIGLTVVFHHSTNGSQGAVTGRSVACADTSTCEAHVDFQRTRLFCREVYRYDDYVQATAWYRTTAEAPQRTIRSRDSRKRLGSTYNPPEACKQGR